MTDYYPVPPGVYYDAEHDNFYAAETHHGMGMAFWTNWRLRYRDFPSKPSPPAEERGGE